MADTHDRETSRDLARDPSRAVQPVLAGVVAVMLVVLAVLVLRTVVDLRHASGFWRLGAVLTAAGIALVALGPKVSKAIAARSRLTTAVSPTEPLTPSEARRTMRRHRRFVPRHRATMLTTLEGRSIPARIVDLSLSGVAVEGRMSDLEFATVARVGSRLARPIRRTAAGAVFGFCTLLDPVGIDENVML